MFTKYDCLPCLLIHQELTLIERCPYSHRKEEQSLEWYFYTIDHLQYTIDHLRNSNPIERSS